MCMCTCVCVCLYVFVCVCVCVHVYVYICTFVFVWVYMCIVCLYICICVCVCVCTCERMCMFVHLYLCVCTYSRRQKKFPRSIRTTGARLKKGGERGMNGNGTSDERTTVLHIRIPFLHFNFPVPVFPCYPRKRAYTHTIRLHTWQNNYAPINVSPHPPPGGGGAKLGI